MGWGAVETVCDDPRRVVTFVLPWEISIKLAQVLEDCASAAGSRQRGRGGIQGLVQSRELRAELFRRFVQDRPQQARKVIPHWSYSE